MPEYSFAVVAASDLTAGDFVGSPLDMSNIFNWHNVNTITFSNFQTVTLTDDDDRFDDDDTTMSTLSESFEGLPAGTKFEPEQYIDLEDSGGNFYRLVAISTDANNNTITAYSFVGDPPPPDVELTITSRTLTDLPDESFSDMSTVCFAAGTWIETPEGEVLVEQLNVGDLVETRDHGAQPLRAIILRRLDFARAPDHLKPVQLRKGALGSNQPDRDLCVSPQHRIMVNSDAEQPVLVAAKALTGQRGVRVMAGKRHVTYVHLAFDRHEIIMSNGIWTESFFPGPMAVQALTSSQRNEIVEIFGAFEPQATCAVLKLAAPELRVQEAKRSGMVFHAPPGKPNSRSMLLH